MANKNTTKTRRRPSKAELERKQAIQRMLISLALAICLIFAALKWGAVGITVYNLIRLLVGSLAYLAIFSLLIYLFFFKWIHKQEGLLAGFFFIFAGLLLIFQAYLVWKLSMANAIFQGTIGQIFKDLTSFQVNKFCRGRLVRGRTIYSGSLFVLKHRYLFHRGNLNPNRSSFNESMVYL